jgi:hypothetical protein
VDGKLGSISVKGVFWLNQLDKILAEGKNHPDITWVMVEDEEFDHISRVIRY